LVINIQSPYETSVSTNQQHSYAVASLGYRNVT